jgi:hypothetical protein
MTSVERFEVSSPAVLRLLDRIREDREAVSLFLKPTSRRWPESHNNPDGPVAWLLGSEEFRSLCPELGAIRRVTGRYSSLNRLEFEGSLTSILLEGGCHGSSSPISLEVARRLVADAVEAAFPAPFGHVGAFRLDDWHWCDFTAEGTLWSTHVAWEGARSIVWFLCTRDID